MSQKEKSIAEQIGDKLVIKGWEAKGLDINGERSDNGYTKGNKLVLLHESTLTCFNDDNIIGIYSYVTNDNMLRYFLEFDLFRRNHLLHTEVLSVEGEDVSNYAKGDLVEWRSRDLEMYEKTGTLFSDNDDKYNYHGVIIEHNEEGGHHFTILRTHMCRPYASDRLQAIDQVTLEIHKSVLTKVGHKKLM